MLSMRRTIFPRRQNGLKSLSKFDVALSLALPNNANLPSARLEFDSYALVSFDVGREFGVPVFRPAFRKGCFLAIWMAVPEAAVNEQRQALLRKDEIGRPRQFFSMETEPVTECVSSLPHPHFRRRILPADARHQP